MKEQWPELKAAIDASESETLKKLADQAEQFDSRLAAAMADAEAQTQDAVEEATEEAQEVQEAQEAEAKSLREKLAELKEKYVSIEGALAAVQKVREYGGIAATVDAVKQSAGEKIRETMAGPELLVSLAQLLGWPAGLVGAAYFFFRRRPISRVIGIIRGKDGSTQEVESV